MTPEFFELVTPETTTDLNAVRLLFEEYAVGLGVDLCFQHFAAEIAHLPGDYAPPRGALWVIKSGQQVVACCALRPLDSVDYPNACEMKRLYVKAAFRGYGLGRILIKTILDSARQAGYRQILLDTLSEMKAARALYDAIGFLEVAPYYLNPIAGARYLKLDL